MRTIHNIKISVFVKAKENEKKALETFLQLIPFNLDEEKLKIEKTTAEGFENKTIQILSLKVDKIKHIKPIIEELKEELNNKDLEKLRTEENRLDSEQSYYLRINKTKLQKDIMELTDSGDCIHIKIKIAAYPKTRKQALEVIKQIFPKNI